jgi:uncharacterized protein (TIGR00255 family)
MPLSSMTGIATLAGEAEGWTWAWEARSVNGRGLDLRLRLPDEFEALEASLRNAAAKAFARGTISISLHCVCPATSGQLRVNPASLAVAIEATLLAEHSAAARGLELVHPSATDLLAMRGVMEADSPLLLENARLFETIGLQIPRLLSDLASARADEGRFVKELLQERVDTIERLIALARRAVVARSARNSDLLRVRLEAVLEAAQHEVDAGRLAQELALIAVRIDVGEELDRLAGHVVAARGLLAESGAVGRKLDFLAQEFNREANTLCSKAQFAELTRIGLDMKVAIDQMREQIQNVE